VRFEELAGGRVAIDIPFLDVESNLRQKTSGVTAGGSGRLPVENGFRHECSSIQVFYRADPAHPRRVMTERLYYTDAYRTIFEAVVSRVVPGSPTSVVYLDRTAFYPTSGGQPFDVGTLAGLRVVDVIDDENGAIGHVVEGTLQEGQPVAGTVDWARRFDHMQQHTGQHVLSAAFVRAAGAATVSFHLGARTATIDLARDLTAAAVNEAVELANQTVWEDRVVSVRFADKDDALALPLRKESKREGVLRLVAVDDFDLSACGGTHVGRTGEIGIIVPVGWERFKGGLRVEFVCGGRALKWTSALRETAASSTRLLSVTTDQMPGAIERLQAENKEMRRLVRSLQARVASQEAIDLTARGRRLGPVTVVVEALDHWDAGGLKTLASAIASEPGRVAALFTTSSPSLAVVAVSSDVGVDAASILRALASRFGGKGGGSRELAQGGGLSAPPDDLVDAAREAIESALGS
jgi:alanyl-tRNA synthetase